jgi:hypothetical protein
MTRLCLFALPLLAACAAAEARPPIGFGEESLLNHRLAGESSVVVPAAAGAAWSGVPVVVTISPAGEVVSAKLGGADYDKKADPAWALAAARRWKFRPFEYRGVAVAARGTITIDYRPPPKWRDPNARFPPIDYSSLRIRLARSNCFGPCPDYEVSIDGSGAVEFVTSPPPWGEPAKVYGPQGLAHNVLLPGQHRAQIGRPALDALIERFRAARFFGLEAEYQDRIEDMPTTALRFETGGRGWTVSERGGEAAGMPLAVTELEEAVDSAAGTARWVKGDEGTVAALRSEGFDFGSPRAAELTAYAVLASQAPEAMILGLLEAGVSPDQPLVFDSGDRPTRLGETLLLAAIGKHRPRLFAYLADRGWLAGIPRERLSPAFAESGGGCDPAVARRLIGAGADADARAFPPAGIGREKDSTALIAAVARYGPCDGVELAPVVAALVELGVDINATDAAGRTVLYRVEDPDLQEQLLALGARADIRDKKGRSPIFSSWSDRIVLGLLEAGADPGGRYDDGKTLRYWARKRMPSVLAWLDAHGID